VRRIAGVVLAAGRSVRFVGTKLLARIDDDPLVRIVVDDVLRAVDQVVVVLGHDADRVSAALAGLPVKFVSNGRYTEGMGTSVGAGVAALPDDSDAVLIVLGDQPVGVAVINSLITAYQQGGHAIVAPVYDGVRGNPVIFDRRFFPELLTLTGDRGARDLIDRHTDILTAVPFAFPPPLDVDTQEDLQKLQRPS
jgi:molybdenum cofactor cytidylyltransferase